MKHSKESKEILRKNESEQLNKAICLIKKFEDSGYFLRDLLTYGEHKALARRLEIAYLLELDYTHNEIADLLGVGVATVSRVNAKLKSGIGLRQIISQLPKREPENRRLYEMSDPLKWYVDWVKIYMNNK